MEARSGRENARVRALHEEQAALRNRVRRKLASCAADSLPSSSAPPPPPGPPPPYPPPHGKGSPSPFPPPKPPLPSPHHPMRAPPPHPAGQLAAHVELQRVLLTLLSTPSAVCPPVRFDALLALAIDRFPAASRADAPLLLGPSNVERALLELQSHVPHAVRLERGELLHAHTDALAEFHARLTGAPRVAAEAEERKGGGRKRTATAAQDDELAEVLDLVGHKSIKEQERQEQTNELLELLNKPTAKQTNDTRRFRTSGGSKLKEFCRSGTREDCARINGAGCHKIHFRRIIKPHTDVTLGDCSYLDTCRHMATCKFVHYEVDQSDALQMRDGQAQLDPFARTATNRLEVDPFARHYESQFINCDIRNFPMEVLGKFPIIMADPPWDIHMELPYGTMADDEMRKMNVQVLQDDGVIFLWVTGRAMELGRECLDIWGYKFVQELLWVKTNQLQRIIRTGRTGHWINHSKEHCLIGIKGEPKMNFNLDCDVVCAEVRETSRKPDEMYDLLERLAPGERKLELFGRPHNVHKGWTTLGNQLGKSQLSEPWLRERLLEEGIFQEGDMVRAALAAALPPFQPRLERGSFTMHPLPKPPDNPIVPPWGNNPPPARISSKLKLNDAVELRVDEPEEAMA